jgi:hypothetical protein
MNPREMGSSIHPRVDYLRTLLKREDLPPGADLLIIEAIQEYQFAFHPDFQGTGDGISTPLSISLPYGDEEVHAGNYSFLSVKFGEEKRREPFCVATVLLNFRSAPFVRIFPDYMRYIPVDEDGNSNMTLFMLPVPEQLSGKKSILEAQVFNGSALRSRLDFEFTPL